MFQECVWDSAWERILIQHLLKERAKRSLESESLRAFAQQNTKELSRIAGIPRLMKVNKYFKYSNFIRSKGN